MSKSVAASVFVAAKYLGEKAGWNLSHLEMQKMLYIAQMFHLGRHARALIKGNFEAWIYGPVHPDLYHRLKMFGSSPVAFVSTTVGRELSDTESGLLEEVLDAFGDAAPGKLVAITHWEEGAWSKNYARGRCGIPIPNEDIIEEYNKRARRSGHQK